MLLQLLLCLFLNQKTLVQSPDEIPVAIYITGLESAKGDLLLDVYNSEESFAEREGAVKRVKVSPDGTKANCEILLPPGQYAFYVHHDENDNGKMDRYFFGMPKEGIAASNNAEGFMGPPDYEDAAFEVTAPRVNLKVKMNYL